MAMPAVPVAYAKPMAMPMAMAMPMPLLMMCLIVEPIIASVMSRKFTASSK